MRRRVGDRDRPRPHSVTLLTQAALKFPKCVVLTWLVLAAVLTLALPTMEQVVARGSTSFLPADAPTVKGLQVMDRAFGSGRANAYAFVVLVDRHGLNRADQATYRALVTKLHAHPQQIVENPGLRRSA